MASFNSVLGISLSELILLLLLRFLLEDYFKIDIPNIFDSFFTIIFIALMVITFNFKLFEKNFKYLELEEKYKTQKENKVEWYKKGIIPFLFAFGPILILIIIL